MIIKSYDLDTPSVYVIYCEELDIEQFKEVLWGIEEEEIPYRVESSDIKNPNNLSYKASLKSKLGIGIGISNEKIVLTTSKLDESNPLISIKLNEDHTKLRSLGSNAARLVKGIELKKI